MVLVAYIVLNLSQCSFCGRWSFDIECTAASKLDEEQCRCEYGAYYLDNIDIVFRRKLEEQLRELREAKDELEEQQGELQKMMTQLEEAKNLEAEERRRQEEEIRAKAEEIEEIRAVVEAKERETQELQQEVDVSKQKLEVTTFWANKHQNLWLKKLQFLFTGDCSVAGCFDGYGSGSPAACRGCLHNRAQ